MRKLIALNHVSLDGVVQAPGSKIEDTSHGFAHGGWSMPYGDESSASILEEIFSRSFDLLLGRRTYELFAGYWPHAESDASVARAFNRAKKFVATRTLTEYSWKNTEALWGEATDAVKTLKLSEGPELHIWGSGEFLQSLLAAQLVDEFFLFVHPVILGNGKRLFQAGCPHQTLQLIHSQSDSTGSVINHYRTNQT